MTPLPLLRLLLPPLLLLLRPLELRPPVLLRLLPPRLFLAIIASP